METIITVLGLFYKIKILIVNIQNEYVGLTCVCVCMFAYGYVTTGFFLNTFLRL